MPSIKKAPGKMDLVGLRMNSHDAVDKHIDRFEEVIEASGTDMKEAYCYFFMTLPDPYKEDLTKLFEGEVPDDIHAAYHCVHTLSMA